MKELSHEQIEKLRALLIKEGINQEDLVHDMLDHLCCLIEQHMDAGDNFEDAYEKTLNYFIPESGLQAIQSQIQNSPNLKYIIMKKFILLFASLALLFFFVTTFLQGLRLLNNYNWNFMEDLAFINQYLICLFILPLYWFNQYNQTISVSDGFRISLKRFIVIIGFLCSESLVNAVFFKIMHLPGGNQLFMITSVLGAVYVPFYGLRKYRLSL